MATAKPRLGRVCEFTLADGTIKLLLEANDEGLTSCLLTRDPAPEFEGSASAFLDAAEMQLVEYFSRMRTVFDVPLCPKGTDFQQQVWNAAQSIPYGQTRSYWWIAVRIGNPYAMRAVGGALGANPLPIIIPCHRVLRQDGGLGGFSCGIEWKERLLGLEAATGQTNNSGVSKI